MTGIEVETLVNGMFYPGDYTTQLNVKPYYKPGIYFCRMQGGKNILTSKLIIE
jgi:hypothetical protein